MLSRMTRCSRTHSQRFLAKKFSTTAIKLSKNNVQNPDDILSKFATNTSSKQDSDTYISAFNKIMSHKEKPQEKGTLQLIFEKNLKDKSKVPIVDSRTVIGKDIRNFPLSVSTNMITHDNKHNKTFVEQIQKKHELKESISPSLKYLESINNDYELISFIEKLLEKFSDDIAKNDDFKNQELTDDLLINIKNSCTNSPSNPSINQFTIPLFLSASIKILSSKFKSPMEAISLFQFVKNLDIKTYTFSCNTEVYNEVLERVWQNFKDIHMIDSIIYEMKINGIIGDMDTISILGLVLNDMEKSMNGEFNNNSFWNQEDEKLVESVGDFRTVLMDRI